MTQFELISQQGNIYGLRLNNGIVYAEANTPYEAFEKSYKALQSTKVEYDSSIKPIKTLNVPKPRVKHFDFNVDFSTKELTDNEATFTFYATAFDQYLQPIEVEYQRTATFNELGSYTVTAKALDVTKSITVNVIEKQEVENKETELDKIQKLQNEYEAALIDLSLEVASIKVGGM